MFWRRCVFAWPWTFYFVRYHYVLWSSFCRILSQFAWCMLILFSSFREALRLRYSLLPYWYTLFAISEKDASPPMAPLLYHFPTDERTFTVDNAFMVGEALLVHPVVHEAASAVDVYLPNGTWYLHADWSVSLTPSPSLTSLLTFDLSFLIPIPLLTICSLKPSHLRYVASRKLMHFNRAANPSSKIWMLLLNSAWLDYSIDFTPSSFSF